jgi:hypothetical protein
MAHAGPVTTPQQENSYRRLPGPVPPEDQVETVDVSEHHTIETEFEERNRYLRQAGGV